MKVSELTGKEANAGTSLLDSHEIKEEPERGLTGAAIKPDVVVGQMSKSGPLFTSPYLGPRHGGGTDR